MLQVIAILAVGAAAVSLVAGLGTYLSVRFTQHRSEPPRGVKRPPAGPQELPGARRRRARPA